MVDRATLERWIANSERNRHRVIMALGPAAVIAVVLLFLVNHLIGAIALLVVGCGALAGIWITSSHIAEWRTEINDMDKPRPVGRAVKRH